MIDVTLSADEIIAAPPEVRRWLEWQMMEALGHSPTGQNGGAPLPASKLHPAAEDVSAADRRTAVRQDELPVTNEAIRRLIAERAYELWETQGRPHGCDLIHWREAELEIMEHVKLDDRS